MNRRARRASARWSERRSAQVGISVPAPTSPPELYEALEAESFKYSIRRRPIRLQAFAGFPAIRPLKNAWNDAEPASGRTKQQVIREIPANAVAHLLKRRVVAGLVSISVVGWATQAFAYRPFDGTDAAVAETGQVEIELGPVEFLREGSKNTLFAPNLRLNYGFAEKWEFTLEGLAAYGPSSESKRPSLVDNEATLKRVLREGSLQDKSGPSIATEFGLLLPGINDEHGTGGLVTGIVSQRWPWITVHLNVEAAVTRDQHAGLFLDAIVEGPHDWTVRPVAEIFHEREFGSFQETSGLLGAIWQVADDIAVDGGFRMARLNDRTVHEVRVGVTFSFPLK